MCHLHHRVGYNVVYVLSSVVKIALNVGLMFLEYMVVIDFFFSKYCLNGCYCYSIRYDPCIIHKLCFLYIYFLNQIFYEMIYSTKILYLVQFSSEIDG